MMRLMQQSHEAQLQKRRRLGALMQGGSGGDDAYSQFLPNANRAPIPRNYKAERAEREKAPD